MYFIVKIKGSKTSKLVPLKWIKSIDYAKLNTYGLAYVKNDQHEVFYSNNFEDEPRFDGALLNEFDENALPARYRAKITHVFGNFQQFLQTHLSFESIFKLLED